MSDRVTGAVTLLALGIPAPLVAELYTIYAEREP